MEKHHVRIGARAVIIEDEAILLNEFNHGLYYNLPGGGWIPGESLRETVAREVKEETGLDVQVGEFLFIGEDEPMRLGRTGEPYQLGVIFRCTRKPKSTVTPPTIPDKPDNPEWHQTGSKWINVRDLHKVNLVPPIDDLLVVYLDTGRFAPQFLSRGDGVLDDAEWMDSE